MDFSRERLGEMLVRAGLITQAVLDEVLEIQTREGHKIGDILVHNLIISEDQLAQTLAGQKGLRFVNLAALTIDRAAVALVPERLMRRRSMVPIGFEDGRLVLAMSDPLDIQAIDDAEMRSGQAVLPVVATESQIRFAIDKYAEASEALVEVAEAAGAEVVEEVEDEAALAGEDVPVVRLVNQIIRTAVRDGASDIHVEPLNKAVRVRYRVDGVLHEAMEIPSVSRAGVTSRIKIMAEMDISERRRPQDGRIALTYEGRPLDLRVATLPTPFGESIVIRILNAELSFKELDDLGMSAQHLERFRWFLSRPYGAVLIAGPTGSGKTTTLYAGLRELNTVERKVVTIEDPIEYQMHGVMQMAVHPRIGLTFATGLRTMLRCDPDIVMIGEIRDPETAEIAIRAALTGHLVLSSIHTNDAPSALTRLLDMDVAPYITSSALLGVVAQRLARRLCVKCKKHAKVDAATLMRAGFDLKEAKTVKPYEAVGCPECFGTGYRGRIGLYEIMEIDDELRRLFLHEAPVDQLRKIAMDNGMCTLRRDALDKVAAGITSLDEVERVVI
ncbi:MAG: type II secretion system protein GspE [Actinobacteria bacterium]|nr:MAG: type II secretion system protein GspE [Actinomycetota bacterium]